MINFITLQSTNSKQPSVEFYQRKSYFIYQACITERAFVMLTTSRYSAILFPSVSLLIPVPLKPGWLLLFLISLVPDSNLTTRRLFVRENNRTICILYRSSRLSLQTALPALRVVQLFLSFFFFSFFLPSDLK